MPLELRWSMQIYAYYVMSSRKLSEVGNLALCSPSIVAIPVERFTSTCFTPFTELMLLVTAAWQCEQLIPLIVYSFVMVESFI